MFRDDYKKDNDLIKPDAAFLERLKKSVSGEQEEQQQLTSTTNFKRNTGRFVAIAALFVLFIGLAVFRNEIRDIVNGKSDGLQTRIFLDRSTEKTEDDTEDYAPSEKSDGWRGREQKKQQYESLKECLKQTVLIYELQQSGQEEAAGMEISKQEEQQLKAGILEDTYKVVQEEKELENPVYYVVSDADGYGFLFAIDDEGRIWIR